MRQHSESVRNSWPVPNRKSPKTMKTATPVSKPSSNRLTLTPATSVPVRQRARLNRGFHSIDSGTDDLRRKLFQDI